MELSICGSTFLFSTVFSSFIFLFHFSYHSVITAKQRKIEKGKGIILLSKTGFRCKISDWYGLHQGYTLTLRPGYTALVGPNGAGKTTLLRQIREVAEKRGYDVFSYSNAIDGGDTAMAKNTLKGNMEFVAASLCSSEGERVAMSFADVVPQIGTRVRKDIATDTPLFILLDGLDSGASIDRTRELMDLFELIERDAGVCSGGAKHEIYILAAVNGYEMARRMCINVRTGESMMFGGYEDYANFICSFFDKFGKEKSNEN